MAADLGLPAIGVQEGMVGTGANQALFKGATTQFQSIVTMREFQDEPEIWILMWTLHCWPLINDNSNSNTTIKTTKLCGPDKILSALSSLVWDLWLYQLPDSHIISYLPRKLLTKPLGPSSKVTADNTFLNCHSQSLIMSSSLPGCFHSRGTAGKLCFPVMAVTPLHCNCLVILLL